jgi:hypothetical protein
MISYVLLKFLLLQVSEFQATCVSKHCSNMASTGRRRDEGEVSPVLIQ